MTKHTQYGIIIYADFDSINGGIAQLARAFGSYPKCRRFKSYFRYQAVFDSLLCYLKKRRGRSRPPLETFILLISFVNGGMKKFL